MKQSNNDRMDAIKKETTPVADSLYSVADISRVIGWVLVGLCALVAFIYIFSGYLSIVLAMVAAGILAWFFFAFAIPRVTEGIAFIANHTYRNGKWLEMLAEQPAEEPQQ